MAVNRCWIVYDIVGCGRAAITPVMIKCNANPRAGTVLNKLIINRQKNTFEDSLCLGRSRVLSVTGLHWKASQNFCLSFPFTHSLFLPLCMALWMRVRERMCVVWERSRIVIHYARKEAITAWKKTHTYTQFNDETLLTAIRIFINQNHIWCLMFMLFLEFRL